MESMEDIQKKLKKILKPKRYNHTLGVRYTAQAMAMRFGEDMEKAGFAGVLHDCAKYMEDKEILEKCDKHHISCSEAERKMPHLLHAKLGVYYARKKYGISDEQILSAIRWHTTGKPSMTALEKIIFIADYIEPGRKMVPDMEKIRRVSFLDLDEAMYLILKNTLSYLQDERMESKGFIDPYTTDAYEYYKHVHDHVIGNGGR